MLHIYIVMLWYVMYGNISLGIMIAVCCMKTPSTTKTLSSLLACCLGQSKYLFLFDVIKGNLKILLILKCDP